MSTPTKPSTAWPEELKRESRSCRKTHISTFTAINVIRERWRKAERDPQPLAVLAASEGPTVDPFEAERRQDREGDNERRLGCLQDCLDRLPPASRELLTVYHLGGRGLHIDRRKDLAQSLNIPAAALRLRVYRIRRQLGKCLGRCLARRGE